MSAALELRAFDVPVRALLALAALMAACSGPQAGVAPVDAGHAPVVVVVATCAEVHGEAQVRRTGKPYWEPLGPGGTLRDGDWVRTLAAASARLEFVQGGSLDLSEKAVVVIELPKPSELPAGVAAASPRVSIESGEVHATASRAPGAAGTAELAPLIVRTADGKTTVLQPAKGASEAEFRLSASDAGLQVAVTRGEATLKSGDKEVAVPTGRAAVLTPEGPSAPVVLPDFPASLSPGIDARVQYEEGLTTARLVWAAVPGAAGYRVQVARDFSFAQGSRTIDVTATSFPLKPEGKGMYAWRVATRGAGGLLGEFGFARRIFFEGEEPKEHLLGPEDGSTVPFAGSTLPTVQFTWLSAAQNPTYRLLVSKSADPQADPLVNVATTAQRAEVSTLAAGEYRWGVYADGKVLKPLFLRPRKLIVKSVPQAVVKTPKKINKWE